MWHSLGSVLVAGLPRAQCELAWLIGGQSLYSGQLAVVLWCCVCARRKEVPGAGQRRCTSAPPPRYSQLQAQPRLG